MSPIINWDELRQLAMPQPPPGAMGKGGNPFDTDESADMYNRMAKMEKIYTLNQLNCFKTTKNDTVLDIGCGPGRISVPMAQRAGSVTALDQSGKMLAHCKRNAQEAGVTNLNPLQLDWKDAELGNNLEQHDIVIASRSPGGQDLKKTASFARKYVVLVGWANAPNVPTVAGDLFIGVGQAQWFSPMRMNRDLSYNITFNMVYDMGFEPNCDIVLDGWTRDFISREEAYAELWLLREKPGIIPPLFKQNCDKWLTENKNGGVTFRRETRSYVIWWEPNLAKL
jgi:SAM-dependent methyltransferase